MELESLLVLALRVQVVNATDGLGRHVAKPRDGSCRADGEAGEQEIRLAAENGKFALVEVGGHCGECHTARGAALQMTASQASDGASFLAGGMADGWFAPSLRNGAAGVGSWSEQQIADFLLTGRNDSGIAFGGMSDAVVHGTSHLTRDDALAMARFLKSLPAENSIAWQPDGSTAHALHTGDVSARGALSFINNCAACHRPDGRGYEGVFPALAGNPVVASSDPTSLVRIVIEGASSP